MYCNSIISILRISLATAILLLSASLSTLAFADCPDKPVTCDFGAIGTQGTCWKASKLTCNDCGPKRCPGAPPTSYSQMPHKTDFACVVKIVLAKQPDGCSNPAKDPASLMYKQFFKPACDEHDICYRNNIGVTKGSCDAQFKRNMDAMCIGYYHGVMNDAQKASCISASITYHSTLALAPQAKEAFTQDQNWTKANCAR